MMNARTLRHRLLAAALLAALVNFAPVRAHAASKEIIALQTQVQQLLLDLAIQVAIDAGFGFGIVGEAPILAFENGEGGAEAHGG